MSEPRRRPEPTGAIYWALFWVVAAVLGVGVCLSQPRHDAAGPGPWPAPTSPAKP